ncbi:MAG: hypothetical protein K2I48_08410 [Muribaculaceae bacterium]|nr:hypothetical protein [Muribaculaceae bacterium]
MKQLNLILLLILGIVFGSGVVEAKKYKWAYGGAYEVYTTGQSSNGAQLVKAWAVAKNADKAIDQAKMDAVSAAFFTGIAYDVEETHGMGVATLPALVNSQQYRDNEQLFMEFFKTGEFLRYVSSVHSSYPTGENNVAVPGGRRVCVSLKIDYPGLKRWLEVNGIKKSIGDYFKN